MSSILPPSQVPQSGPGEPAWELALLYPAQGTWSVSEYLSLTEQTKRLIEFTDGKIEVLEMPTIEHQLIVLFLIDVLRVAAGKRDGGMALMAPHPMKLQPTLIREPDIVFKLRENLPGPDEQYFHGADLVIEVVSPDKSSHQRDYETKKREYAQAGIPEYWIVDPQEKKVTVLALAGESYDTVGIFQAGDTATSKLLPEFTVNVSDVWAAGKKKS